MTLGALARAGALAACGLAALLAACGPSSDPSGLMGRSRSSRSASPPSPTSPGTWSATGHLGLIQHDVVTLTSALGGAAAVSRVEVRDVSR
jgi:hypothetical protein